MITPDQIPTLYKAQVFGKRGMPNHIRKHMEKLGTKDGGKIVHEDDKIQKQTKRNHTNTRPPVDRRLY